MGLSLSRAGGTSLGQDQGTRLGLALDWNQIRSYLDDDEKDGGVCLLAFRDRLNPPDQ